MKRDPEFPYATERAKVERWKDRQKTKPVCPKCGHAGYTQDKAPGDGRPRFTCTGLCGFQWTAGKDGRHWAKEA